MNILRDLPIKSISLSAGMLGLAILSGCQTSGSDGVFSGALPSGSGTASETGTDVAAVQEPQRTTRNPNAKTRLINTRTALSEFCPTVTIRAGTETYRIIPKGKDKEDPRSVRYQATITKAARECAYIGQQLEIKVGARGRIIAGPAGGPGTIALPIRVAVTQSGDTIYSKLYRPSETLGSGESGKLFSFVDEKVLIPAPTDTDVKVFIGFDEGPYNTP